MLRDLLAAIPTRSSLSIILPTVAVVLAWPTPGRQFPAAGTPGATGLVETGRIEGIATIATSLTTSRTRVRVYDEPGTAPARPERESHPLDNVVLYLASSVTLRGAAPSIGHAVPALRQSGERFVPHVLPILAGTTVEFPNDDPIFHNVFSLSHTRSFDLGRYPRGSSRSVTFARTGVVQVFCHIHADMSGYIVVLDNPFFVVPDTLGSFALDGIPAGDYTIVAWHERIRPFMTPVHVDAGQTTTLELRIPLPEVGPAP